MDLFLVRHGETSANKAGIVQGWLDTSLNEEGAKEAKQAAALFDEDIDVIYSSDLQRARQTAAEFRHKYPAVPYFEDRRLRERDFGDATGTHRDRVDWAVFWAASDTVSIPNAETLAAFNERVLSFVKDIKAAGFARALIVTHGGTINRLRALTTTDQTHVQYGNASVTHLVVALP